MDLASSFRNKITLSTKQNSAFRSYRSQFNQEVSSINYTPRNSQYNSSQLATPTKIRLPRSEFSSEPSKFSRSSHLRHSHKTLPTKVNSLAYAIKNNDLISLKRALKLGQNPNEVDSSLVPVILLTLENSGKPDFLKVLLDAGADPNSKHPISQRTALHLAAKYGFQSVARQLLSLKVNVNSLDSKGETPLMYAIKGEHVSMARLLIQHSSQMNIKNYNNETALHLAVEKGNLEIVDLLYSNASYFSNHLNCNGSTPLLLACKSNFYEIADLIIDKIDDLSTIDLRDKENGKSALHWAVKHGNIDLIEKLLYLRADPNSQDFNSETPFLLAVKSLLPSHIVETFLRCDSNVKVKDRLNKTVLHYAVTNSNLEIIPMLVIEGCNLDSKCSSGMTPLMISSYKNHPYCTDLLLNLGAKQNLPDSDEVTPLVYAILGSKIDSEVDNDNIETVLSLIRNGADVDKVVKIFNLVKKFNIKTACDLSNIPEVRLYSPMEIAYLMGNCRVFEILIQSGCNLNGFMIEFLELNEYYEKDYMKFEKMIEIWKYQKTNVKTLAELCRKSYIRFVNNFNLFEDEEHSEILRDIFEEIKQPLFYHKIKKNIFYESCRKPSSTKTPVKFQRSLSYRKSKTPQHKTSLQKLPHTKINQKNSTNVSMSQSKNSLYDTHSSKKFISQNAKEPVSTKTNGASQKFNIFDRLYMSVKPKSKLTKSLSSRETLQKNKEHNNEIKREVKQTTNCDKPKKKLVLMQNFLTR